MAIFTSAMDKKIIKVYKTKKAKDGSVGKLLKELNISQRALKKRVLELGLEEYTINQKVWSREELEVLKQLSYLSAEQIQQKLKRRGFNRTVVSISNAKAKKIKKIPLANADFYSIQDIADGLGVTYGTVYSWVKQGLIKTKRTNSKHADDYYCSEEEIRDFIKNHGIILNLSKVMKEWFLSVIFPLELK